MAAGRSGRWTCCNRAHCRPAATARDLIDTTHHAPSPAILTRNRPLGLVRRGAAARSHHRQRRPRDHRVAVRRPREPAGRGIPCSRGTVAGACDLPAAAARAHPRGTGGGAGPGDVLEIRIIDAQLRQDWGYTFVRPLAGALPGEVDAFEQIVTRLDSERNVGLLPWGLEIPLRPFFGVMGVAPPRAWGSISSIQPRAHGGNLDNKELVPRSTLYLPVFNQGAGFSVGDGHAVQGDGEVCTTAIETALTGTFEIHLRKDLRLDYPAAETPAHLITMGMDPDLDTAAKDALRRMVDSVVRETGLSRNRALMLMSLVADVRVTQLVNENKGIHVMMPKTALRPAV